MHKREPSPRRASVGLATLSTRAPGQKGSRKVRAGTGRIPGKTRPSAKGARLRISPDFPLELTGFFPGKHLIRFLVLKMKDFRNFVLHNCILVFDAEQVYLKLQVINLKNKEVIVNPQPQTLEKKCFFENPKP